MNHLFAPAETVPAGWTVSLKIGLQLEIWHGKDRLTARLDLPFLAGFRRFRPARIAWGLAGLAPLPDAAFDSLPGGGFVSLSIEQGHPVLRIERGALSIGVRLKGEDLLRLQRFADEVDAYRLCRSDAIPTPVCSGPLCAVKA